MCPSPTRGPRPQGPLLPVSSCTSPPSTRDHPYLGPSHRTVLPLVPMSPDPVVTVQSSPDWGSGSPPSPFVPRGLHPSFLLRQHGVRVYRIVGPRRTGEDPVGEGRRTRKEKSQMGSCVSLCGLPGCHCVICVCLCVTIRLMSGVTLCLFESTSRTASMCV